MTWTNAHGDDGLRRKFDVHKPRDGRIVEMNGRFNGGTAYPYDKRLGADGEFVFVLRPESDAQAWTALWDYAQAVKVRAPQLADDMENELMRIALDNA